MKENEISQVREASGVSVQCKASSPRRILVVEDDQGIRRMNAVALHHAGYRVDTAQDGAFAWEALNVSRYDLMITDNNMPNLTGMELLKKLHTAHMILPFIMATGTMPEEEFIQQPWLRPAATLHKPYTVEELLGAVKKTLREADGAATGSQFVCDDDVKHSKIPQTGELAGEPVQGRKGPARRILVVQDEPDLRLLNAEVLKNSGYEVDTVEDGKAGWETLHATRHAPESYALLITDHDMPGSSGLALVKKLRDARMALPVIMSTGRLSPEDLRTRYLRLQPLVTLVRPYSIEQLLGTVEAVLRTVDSAGQRIAPPDNDLRL